MHCSRRRLLRRGLESHVCTINKSAHTKKVWKLIHVYIYIYIYIKMFRSSKRSIVLIILLLHVLLASCSRQRSFNDEGNVDFALYNSDDYDRVTALFQICDRFLFRFSISLVTFSFFSFYKSVFSVCLCMYFFSFL